MEKLVWTWTDALSDLNMQDSSKARITSPRRGWHLSLPLLAVPSAGSFPTADSSSSLTADLVTLRSTPFHTPSSSAQAFWPQCPKRVNAEPLKYRGGRLPDAAGQICHGTENGLGQETTAWVCAPEREAAEWPILCLQCRAVGGSPRHEVQLLKGICLSGKSPHLPAASSC